MSESTSKGLEEDLTAVMHRFRDSFLGEGINLSEDKVPFRERPDFPTPLVTVLGHTYGLRLTTPPSGQSSESEEAGLPAIETSVNVYDDEFQLERFKEDLREIYEWSQVGRIVANFATPEDEAAMGKEPEQLASLFHFDPDIDVEVVEKEKETASVVTGRLIDTILKVRYRLDASQADRFRDRNLFVTAVYLYCLRPFAAAYRKSLTAASPGLS